MLGVFRVETGIGYVWLMLLEVKMQGNGRRKMFIYQETTKKVRLMFSDIEVPTVR